MNFMYYAFTIDNDMLYHTESCECCCHFPQYTKLEFEHSKEAELNGFLPCDCTQKHVTSKENIYEYVNSLCSQYQIKMERVYDWIFIKTLISEWKFIPRNGNIKLYHKSIRNTQNQEFHLQFRENKPLYAIIKYICKHDSLNKRITY